MLSFGRIVALTAAGVALSSYILLSLVPFGLGQFSMTVVFVKITAVACWLAASWRVKKRRENVFDKKTLENTLWTGPVSEDGLCVPMNVLEMIRYRFDADEEVVRIFRRHKVVLWEVGAHLTIIVMLGVISYMLHRYYPSIHYHSKPSKILHSKAEEVRFTIWWIPLLLIPGFLHQALKKWQDWKWTIRVITTKNFYLLREQSTYMPWTGKKFTPYANHQIIAISNNSESVSGMVGWGELTLTVRADEHDDQPEKVIIDYVPDDDECESKLRSVLPVYANV